MIYIHGCTLYEWEASSSSLIENVVCRAYVQRRALPLHSGIVRGPVNFLKSWRWVACDTSDRALRTFQKGELAILSVSLLQERLCFLSDSMEGHVSDVEWGEKRKRHVSEGIQESTEIKVRLALVPARALDLAMRLSHLANKSNSTAGTVKGTLEISKETRSNRARRLQLTGTFSFPGLKYGLVAQGD